MQKYKIASFVGKNFKNLFFSIRKTDLESRRNTAPSLWNSHKRHHDENSTLVFAESECTDWY